MNRAHLPMLLIATIVLTTLLTIDTSRAGNAPCNPEREVCNE